MTGFRRIAVCVDDDGASRDALAAARRLLEPGGELMGVHVLANADLALLASPTMALPPLQESTEHGRAFLHELLDEASGERPVLLAGEDPAQAVCAWAEGEPRPDLIVVAAVRGRLSRALRGAFAAYLAYHAPCPVLVVHHEPAPAA
ncbi:MAG: universal stress protein [Thermoleophilia bacterium]|nr:universal stress protein [Thermoleophilia bacterium]